MYVQYVTTAIFKMFGFHETWSIVADEIYIRFEPAPAPPPVVVAY